MDNVLQVYAQLATGTPYHKAAKGWLTILAGHPARSNIMVLLKHIVMTGCGYKMSMSLAKEWARLPNPNNNAAIALKISAGKWLSWHIA